MTNPLRQLARRMLERRYPDAHFNVSYLDFFVQGVSASGSLCFGPGLARAAAAANGLLARWDDPTGFDAPELPFVHSYGEFLVEEGLVRFDWADWARKGGGEGVVDFAAGLAPAGAELVAYLLRLRPDLLNGEDPIVRAARVIGLRRHLFREEIQRGELEARRESERGDLAAALGWAFGVLRLDPDSPGAREVVAAARAAEPVLPEVEADTWLPAVEAVDGWLSPPEAEALARCVAAAPGDRAPAMVEIGSYKGRSTLAIARTVSALGLARHLTAVDPHEGYRYGDGCDTWSELRSNLRLHQVDSIVTVVRDRGDTVPIPAPLCFAFVDGLHDAESVRADFEHIAPHLVPGALVAFHDYFEHYPGIVELVGELTAGGRFRFLEYADRLGVLRLA